MRLERDQVELLRQFVEAHQKASVRDLFIMSEAHSEAMATFSHRIDDSLRFQGSRVDAEILASCGFLRKDGSTFTVLPKGIDFVQHKI